MKDGEAPGIVSIGQKRPTAAFWVTCPECGYEQQFVYGAGSSDEVKQLRSAIAKALGRMCVTVGHNS